MRHARTLHQDAVERIATGIVSGRYRPGAPLPTESELGEALGVSRTVIREAMRTLAAKGMVRVRRRHGTTIEPLDTWSLFDPQVMDWRLEAGLTREFAEDLVRFRLGLEPFAAALCAENPDFPDDVLEDAFARMSAAVDGEGDYHAADLDFHRTILDGTRNQFMRQLAPMLDNALRVSIRLSVIDMGTARDSLPLHRAVADAIVARDPKGAARALTSLIESAREDIRLALERRERRRRSDAKGDRLAVSTT